MEKQQQNNSSAPYQFYLEDVSYSYTKNKTNLALNSIKAIIYPKDFIVVTGESGAGKTTLLRLISNECSTFEGRRKLGSKDIFISRVFQELNLLENLSIKDNLLFSYNEKKHSSKKQFFEECESYFKILNLNKKLSTKIKELNSGAKQKVAIIRSVLSKPDVLIADEPSSFLSKNMTHRLFELFEFLNNSRGMTIIWATHDREVVGKYGIKNIHLVNGKIAYNGNIGLV